jgi:hypothetical protein
LADKLGARKDACFKAVCTAPSINKTPVGGAIVPIAYPVSQDLSSSVSVSPNVNFNDKPAYILASSQPTCVGDAAGVNCGVKSGTVSGEVKPVKGSSTVQVNKQPVIREGDPCTLNGGNCPGIYVAQAAPAAMGADSNPPVKPETPKEKSFWEKASPWVHGALGIASFVPGVALVAGGVDAAIYAGEGDLVNAGLAVATMVPGGKVVTTAGKVLKELTTVGKEAEVAAKLAHDADVAAKALKEEEQAAKAVNEATKEEQAAKNAAKLKKAEEEAPKPKPKDEPKPKEDDGVKVKGKGKGPCDHLNRGKGTGKYRGGAHGDPKQGWGTSSPKGDDLDSHHMPPKGASPLSKSDGPAIQMDKPDHFQMPSSGGDAAETAAAYLKRLADLISQGKWQEVMDIEIEAIRKRFENKYNEAIDEMLQYFDCLKKHGLLPMPPQV